MAHINDKIDSQITIPLVLGEKESKIKVGKILDPIVYQNSQITQQEGKSFVLLEKRENKPDNKFIGTNFAEQTSKYLILKYNESTRRLEAYSATEWYSFKKSIQVNTTQSLEDDDNRRKKPRSIIDLFKKKGVPEPVKKTRKKKSLHSNFMSRAIEEEEDIQDEDKKGGNKEDIKDDESDGFSSENDPELKDIPSDIEEGLNMKKEEEGLEKIVMNKMKQEKKEEEEEEDDDDDLDFNDSSEVDEEIEKADSVVDEEDVAQMIGSKREREEDIDDDDK